MDDDGSNEVTPFEFKQACRAYGFPGPAKLVFKALDTTNKGMLSSDDVGFLDDWCKRAAETGPPESSIEDGGEDASPKSSVSKRSSASPMRLMSKQSLRSIPDEAWNEPDWQEGSLHPAFRVWANRKRKMPIRKLDGSLPPLVTQVDLGDPHLVKRPILLLAPVPVRVQVPMGEAEPKRAVWLLSSMGIVIVTAGYRRKSPASIPC